MLIFKNVQITDPTAVTHSALLLKGQLLKSACPEWGFFMQNYPMSVFLGLLIA